MAHAFQKEFDAAKSALLEASKIVTAYFSSTFVTSLKADNSVVTEADQNAEAFIRERLHSLYPTYGFIGEESDADVKDVSWIVDPVDGTSSFARGLPDFSMALALKADENVVFSCIYSPTLNWFFHAVEGEGAFKNGKAIRVSVVDDLTKGLLSFDRKTAKEEYSRTYFENLFKKYKVRVGDFAGLGSCYLAQGSLEVFVKFYQQIWDTAPEYLIMKEAGAIVSDEYGKPLQLQFAKGKFHNYIAATPSIHKTYSQEIYFRT